MFNTPTAAVLKQGIDMRKRVSFEYDGRERIVEVHAMGLTKTGKECIRGYQVEGGSISGEDQGWKLFSINRIKDEKLLDDDGIVPRDGYVPNDSALPMIEAQL